MSTIKKFEVFTGDKQLDLIRVVDNLVCGYGPEDTFKAPTNAISLKDIAKLSFTLSAKCTNYCPPFEKQIEEGIASDIEDLVDFSTSMGASSILIPMSRYDSLNQVFKRAIAQVNQERGREAAQLATGLYEPILSYRGNYDSKRSQSMFSSGVRGIWYFQSETTREIA